MRRKSSSGRGFCRGLVVAAAATLLLAATASRRAEAFSPVNAGALATASQPAKTLTTPVAARGAFGAGGGGSFHAMGGGGAFHAAPAFRGSGIGYSGIRAAPVYRGIHYGGVRYGGLRYGAYRYGGYRFAFHHRHFHRRFFVGGYYPYYSYPYDYDYPYYYRHHHRCRVVWTHHGPRRICHWHRGHHGRRIYG